MKVVSELVNMEFQVGAIARQGDELIIESTPDSTLAARIVVSPTDAATTFGRLLFSPPAWGFLLRLPFALLRGSLDAPLDRDWEERRRSTGLNKPW